MLAVVACGGAPAAPTCTETVTALGNGRVDHRLVALCASWPDEARQCLARTRDLERCLPMPALPLSLIAPSQATRQLVAGDAQPLRAKLFGDLANPNDAAAVSYAKALMEVEVVPSLVEHVIRIYRGAKWIEVPIDPTDKIAYLDREVAAALAHVHDTRRAYYVTGHGEVPFVSQGALKLSLGVENVSLAPVELTSSIPADAALVVWVGPVQPLPVAEQEVLARYLTRGGKLIAAFDPPYDLGPLAPILGMRVDPVVLRDRQPGDGELVPVGRSGTHPSIGKVANTMVANHVGALTPAGMSTAKVTFTLATPISTWRDANNNNRLDPDEPPQAYPVGAASDGYAFRALVFGSGSLWSGAMPVQPYLASMLRWLLGEDREIEVADAAVPSQTLLDALAARKDIREARQLAIDLRVR